MRILLIVGGSSRIPRHYFYRSEIGLVVNWEEKEEERKKITQNLTTYKVTLGPCVWMCCLPHCVFLSSTLLLAVCPWERCLGSTSIKWWIVSNDTDWQLLLVCWISLKSLEKKVSLKKKFLDPIKTILEFWNKKTKTNPHVQKRPSKSNISYDAKLSSVGKQSSELNTELITDVTIIFQKSFYNKWTKGSWWQASNAILSVIRPKLSWWWLFQKHLHWGRETIISHLLLNIFCFSPLGWMRQPFNDPFLSICA